MFMTLVCTFDGLWVALRIDSTGAGVAPRFPLYLHNPKE